jgi:rhodanese-related sulfurtransferase
MRKKSLTILFLVILSQIVLAQKKEYVCMPCGSACDKKIYTQSGTCESCHMQLVDKQTIKFKSLSVEEFCARISDNTNAVILDVRSESEFKGRQRNTFGHFKNAININVTELKSRLSELQAYKNREILVYCSHSVRSPRACILLVENGFKNVSNMDGGVSTIPKSPGDCLAGTYVPHK